MLRRVSTSILAFSVNTTSIGVGCRLRAKSAIASSDFVPIFFDPSRFSEPKSLIRIKVSIGKFGTKAEMPASVISGETISKKPKDFNPDNPTRAASSISKPSSSKVSSLGR